MTLRFAIPALVAALAACGQGPEPYLLITSDVHISNPAGRWPDTTQKFELLLNQLRKAPPQLLFVVGDVVDNVQKLPDGGVRAGDHAHWIAEVELYQRLQLILPHTEFQQTLGPGHDFVRPVSLAMAEQTLGPRRGSKIWQGFKLIWLTIPVASFWPEARQYYDSLEDSDYEWLTNELRTTQRAILLFHVPLRTDATFGLGRWPGGLNLTVDPRDQLYRIIDAEAERIKSIFNGHIHRFVNTDYRDIPVYLCPFFYNGCHCKVYSRNGELVVQPISCSTQ